MDASMTPETAHALLFDCDGTLVQSLAAYEQAWTRAFAGHGVAITPAWYRARTGLSPQSLIRAAEIDYRITLDADAVETRAVSNYLEAADAVLPNQPILDIARRNHGRVLLAVVSGGPRAGVLSALRAVHASSLFDHVIAIEDVERGKPAPDLYHRAVEAVGRPAATCLAFEDTAEGLAAATAAGVPAIDVRDGRQTEQFVRHQRLDAQRGGIACGSARPAEGDTRE